MSAELLRELTDFIVSRPGYYRFSNGVSAGIDESGDLLWLTSPYGVDTSVSYRDSPELRQQLRRYLSFWTASRNENGELI